MVFSSLLEGCRTGPGWDAIDERQNMRSYDKILRLDTGVSEFQR
jgi:hypothetical protein